MVQPLKEIAKREETLIEYEHRRGVRMVDCYLHVTDIRQGGEWETYTGAAFVWSSLSMSIISASPSTSSSSNRFSSDFSACGANVSSGPVVGIGSE